MSLPETAVSIEPAWAFERYEAIRARLPQALAEGKAQRVANLAALAGRYDAFVLDAFGVINVGETAIPGALEAVAALKAMGKAVLVVTNGATVPGEEAVKKYHRYGYGFTRAEVISSRDALAEALAAWPEPLRWGFAATAYSQLGQLAGEHLLLEEDPRAYEEAEGFVLLSSLEWTRERQALLRRALIDRPRPLLVGNPDLVAPREWGLSAEPGYYAHLLADEGLAEPRFFGKPFPEVFALAERTLAPLGIERSRICMVGDTLHTDILGGAAAGWGTVLVTDHGLYKGRDPEALMHASGLWPDFLVPSI
jgi:HAD superfamily hydrolase (TIGR01450 family)